MPAHVGELPSLSVSPAHHRRPQSLSGLPRAEARGGNRRRLMYLRPASRQPPAVTEAVASSAVARGPEHQAAPAPLVALPAVAHSLVAAGRMPAGSHPTRIASAHHAAGLRQGWPLAYR